MHSVDGHQPTSLTHSGPEQVQHAAFAAERTADFADIFPSRKKARTVGLVSVRLTSDTDRPEHKQSGSRWATATPIDPGSPAR